MDDLITATFAVIFSSTILYYVLDVSLLLIGISILWLILFILGCAASFVFVLYLCCRFGA